MINYSIKPDDGGRFIVTIEPFMFCGNKVDGCVKDFKFEYLAERCVNNYKRDWLLGSYNHMVQTIKKSVNADSYYPTRQKSERLTRLNKLNAYIQDPQKTVNQIGRWIIQLDAEITGAFPSSNSQYFNELQSIHTDIKAFITAQYPAPKKQETTEQMQLWKK